MKKLTISKIKKSIVALALVGVAVVGSSVMMPMKVSAATHDYALNHNGDSDAPNVAVSSFPYFEGMSGQVDQYKIEPGKYYIIMKNNIGFGNGMARFNYRLVKVLNVYEDPRWYGSERTVDVIYCDDGTRGSICPNAGFSGSRKTYFYETDKYVVK